MTTPLNIGLVYPGGGCEADFYRFEMATEGAVRLYLAQARHCVVDGADHDPEALRQTARVNWIAEAALRLSAVPLDVIVWACTSGSFINGPQFADEQIAELERLTSVPTTSTSIAFIAAAETLSIKSVSVLATYPQPTAHIFASFLGEHGIEVASLASLDFSSGWISSNVGPEDFKTAALNAAKASSDALFVPDTALPTLSVLDELETELAFPVITANAVSLWHGLRIAKQNCAVDGCGSLLAT